MRLVHSYSPFEEVCVLFDDGHKPAEISVWRENDLKTGALHVAQAVRSVSTGWFLDVGDGKSAYMNNPPFYLKPDGTICKTGLTQGDRLIVRIIRPETWEKEAEASYKVSLSGQTVVWTPTQSTPSFSRRLDQAAIDRLKLLAPNDGVLFRTAARDGDLNEISAEIEKLKRLWQSLLSVKKDRAGVLFPPLKDIRQYAEKYRKQLTEIVTDDSQTAAILKQDGFPVTFDVHGVWNKECLDEVLDAAVAEKTALPCGGCLMTQQTAACVCFDVNSGAVRPAEANEEACYEILRQIRLKGLGGQMIIDFAGRKDEKIIRRLLPKLKDEKIFISGISTLGLVELTVEKTRRSLLDLFSDDQRAVRTAARLIRRLWFASGVSEVKISASPAVLNGVRPYLGRLEERLGAKIELRVSEILNLEGMQDENT